MTTERPSWEQRNRPGDSPRESGEAYAAFIAYRDMPIGERSLEALSRILSKAVQLLKIWSSKHQWQERVADWDRVQRARLDEKAEKSFDEIRLEQRKKRQEIITALHDLLDKTLQAAKGAKDGLNPADLHRVARAAGVIMEQSRREMNDLPVSRAELAGPNGGPIQTEGTLTGGIPQRMAELDDWLKRRRAEAVDIPPEDRE